MISILIPTFNAESYISDTLRSIFLQKTSTAVEVIIIDGCSVDRTLEICNEFSEQITGDSFFIDNKKLSIRVLSEPDRGMYDAIAKGFELVRGDVVGYLNASDILLPGSLQAIETAFRNNPHVKWLTGWNSFLNNEGVITYSQMPFGYPKHLIQSYFYGRYHNHIQQESTFWSRELLSLVDVAQLSSFKYAGDFYLWYTFSAHHTLWTVNALIGGFRVHPGQLSSQLKAYHAEAKSIAKHNRPNIFSALAYRFLEQLPTALKFRLHRNLIKI